MLLITKAAAEVVAEKIEEEAVEQVVLEKEDVLQ
jgi:hypothetical protein